MSSYNPDRDLVFCHVCENEWFKDEHGLVCPSCNSDFTEVIELGHDPRERDDPDDLDDHNPWQPNPAQPENGGGINSWTVRSGPNSMSVSGTFVNSGPGAPPPHPFGPGGPFEMNPLFGPFASMLQGISGQRFGGEQQFPTGRGQRLGTNEGPNVVQFPGPVGRRDNRPRVEIYSNTAPGGFTWRSSTRSETQPGQPRPVGQEELNQIIGSIFGSMGRGLQPGGIRGEGGPPANPLAALFAPLLDPANAAHGDAVFTQEAFDRVMTQLMEQHTSGSAPGPASQAAIDGIPKKKISNEMLDEKTGMAECSICMDNVEVGETVSELPCGHWFHPPCIEAWLREHDTCPHCRAGITPKEGSRDTVRSPTEPPLHDEDPFLLARRESGTREHPFTIPASPLTSRRRPSDRRRSDGPSSPRRESGSRDEGSSGGGGFIDRARNFFSGGSGDRRH